MDVMELNLNSLNSVRRFAASFNSLDQHLNILTNNAEIMGCPFQILEDGIELRFVTNHLVITMWRLIIIEVCIILSNTQSALYIVYA